MNPDAIKGGGSAYPYKVIIEGPGYDPVTQKEVPSGTAMHHHFPGMSLRDHFAGLAMTASVHKVAIGDYRGLAEAAYDLADAMIKARG